MTTQGTGALHLDDNATFTGGTTQDDVIGGNLSIDTGATFTAPSTAGDGTVTIGGTYSNSGTFTARCGRGDLLPMPILRRV